MNSIFHPRLLNLYLLIASLSLTACASSGAVFSDKELKERVALSPEQQFEIDNFITYNCTEWERDKPFLYVADELNMLLQPIAGGTPPVRSYRNKLFTFHSMSEESPYGVPHASLVFECEGELYKFDTNRGFDSLLDKSYTPFLPHMVSLDRVERAKKVLIGKKLYIKTAVWYNENQTMKSGRKMVPITITDVVAGTERLSAFIQFIDVKGNTSYVFMNLPSSDFSKQYLTFHRLFDFENPRLAYPLITDKHWELITQSKVCVGMTKDECRLSLGLPTEVNRVPTYTGLVERWHYASGMYYVFEDGILTQAR